MVCIIYSVTIVGALVSFVFFLVKNQKYKRRTSTAQHAKPNVMGHIEPFRAQFARSSILATTYSARSLPVITSFNLDGSTALAGGAAVAEENALYGTKESRLRNANIFMAASATE
jgi:hypothetical protein